jgi:hypothetical protein
MSDIWSVTRRRYLPISVKQIHLPGSKMKTIDSVTSKKCWRERVTAEITVAHLIEFAREAGDEISAKQAEAFLNENGHAYEMWKHMMRAGEEFIKNNINPRMPMQTVRESDAAQMVN